MNPHSIRRTAIASALMVLALQAHATEGASVIYPMGVDTVLNGIMPAPGNTQFYSYTQYYSADKFAGGNGDAAIPGFSLRALVEAPRVLHTWNTRVGPFSLTSGAVLPVIRAKLRAGPAAGEHTGLGDITIHPLIFGYMNAAHNFFAYVSPDFSLPTGSYSPTRMVNTGSNTKAAMPIVSMTWFPARGVELSMSSMAEFRETNKATGYASGNVSVTDFNAGYSVTPTLQLSLQGYVMRQFSDDKLHGVKVGSDGFRGRVMGLGPQLRYNLGPTTGLVVKYQTEFSARNRPQGARLWFELTMPI